MISSPRATLRLAVRAIPPGGEPAARTFYGEVLGLTELPKPEALRGRGGLWFQAGPVQLHLGVEPDFSEASLENVAAWPGGEPVEEVTAETREAALPAIEESTFWGNGGARDFDWGD